MMEVKRFLNALVILIICGVLTAAYAHQIFAKEDPCPLCLLQRIGMIGICTAALMNLCYGMHSKHYGMILIAAMFGMIISLRHIALHICPGFPKFGTPVLGLSLYTWAFIVFFLSILGAAVTLMLPCDKTKVEERTRLNWIEKIAAGYLLFLTFANVLTTYQICGFSPCQG
jgi:disulfide bond formation protein DsbB